MGCNFGLFIYIMLLSNSNSAGQIVIEKLIRHKNKNTT